MTTAVIGTGFVGGTLGRAFARAGIPTVFGSRHPEDGSVAGSSGAEVVSVGAAVQSAGTLVLTQPAAAVEDFLRRYGDALAGRLVVDATNDVGRPVAHKAREVAKYAPGARYARAFNTLGGENFADPRFDGIAADLFFSAPVDDRAAVEELIAAVGLRPMYVGEGQEDVVDGVLRLWFALAVGQGHGRELAFRTLSRP
ncbi:NAD(P)-binding domain-containing protein [Streptomyces sp. A7024]|uniref:NAD(P)-binding domain-containing protein n=1 Tax=Streptomyces coryli TaxID=1128680 RepID=A0A6G4TSR6_9ACTN|nr:NAD(P)-binding domain-containing protein [Streptomyces coryli]NGN62822.1 NAD(P)-binding domain-containing protein [Streptomyces coryli]